MASTIMIVEDNDDLRNSFKNYFKQEGYDVLTAENSSKALEILDEIKPIIINTFIPVIIILDVRLPDIDGLKLCQIIRQQVGNSVYIIMISGVYEELVDKVVGLEMGSDRYMTKDNLDMKLLRAEVRVGERRLTPDNGPTIDEWDFEDAYLRFNLANRKVQVRENELEKIPQLEFRLLKYLFERAGTPCSRYDLLENVWLYENPDNVPEDSSINTCISRLRAKIEPDPHNPVYLLTYYGVGYKFKDLED